jgi:hypothetical protein
MRTVRQSANPAMPQRTWCRGLGIPFRAKSAILSTRRCSVCRLASRLWVNAGVVGVNCGDSRPMALPWGIHIRKRSIIARGSTRPRPRKMDHIHTHDSGRSCGQVDVKTSCATVMPTSFFVSMSAGPGEAAARSLTTAASLTYDSSERR